MKALLRLVRGLMLPQRVWPWLCGLAALETIVTIVLGRPFQHHRSSFMLTSLLLLVPFCAAPTRFRRMISNERLALLPGFRLRAGLALFVVAVYGSVVSALTHYHIEAGRSEPFWTIAAYMFVWLTSFFLVGQWPGGQSFYWLFLLAYMQLLRRLPVVQAAVTMPAVVLSCVALALAAWAWTFHWLRGARTIVDGWRRKSSDWVQPDWLIPRFSFPGLRPAGTLLRGRADGWRRQLVRQVFLLAGIPLFLLLVIAVLRLGRAGTTTFPVERPQLLLVASFVGGLQFAFLSRDWLPRTRLLWLRLEGDRSRIWRQVERLIVEEIGLSLGVAAIFAVLLLGLTQLTLKQALAFVLASGACVGFSIYLSQWLRLLDLQIGSLPAPAGALMLSVALGYFELPQREPVAVSVSGSSQLGLTATLCALAFALSGAALALRHSARNRFLKVDWCQLRPTPSLGARRAAANEV